MSETVEIRVGPGQYALIDAEDEAMVRAWAWTVSHGYARGRRTRNGVVRRVGAMHRLILGLERGDPRQTDHINGDRLDNRRANLRIVTDAENKQNVQSRRDSSSRYRGVAWDRTHGYWIAYANLAGKHHRIGRYSDEDEAGRAAAQFRAEHMPFSQEALEARAA